VVTLRVLCAIALATLALAGPATADDGPALETPAGDLAAALDCPKPIGAATRAPVLLIHGTNLDAESNYDWNYMPALTDAGIPWCAVTLPVMGMGDIQTAAEYVVFAIRWMFERGGREVSIVGFSQGGMIGRWALLWWPDTRAMVEDLIGNASSNHGTVGARGVCASSCAPSYWQQRDDSEFIAALNDGPETFAGIDYTVNFTHYDQVVTPNLDAASGSSALRSGDGEIQNTAVQDICPSNTADHLVLGSYDPVAWALVLDALENDGPANPDRIDPAVCTQQYMPGVAPGSFAADWLRYMQAVGQGFNAVDPVAAEPKLRCYVTDTCPAKPLKPPCVERKRFRLVLPKAWKSARVWVAGDRVKVRKRKDGRRFAVINLRGRAPGVVRVKARGKRASGKRVGLKRRYRVCRKSASNSA